MHYLRTQKNNMVNSVRVDYLSVELTINTGKGKKDVGMIKRLPFSRKSLLSFSYTKYQLTCSYISPQASYNLMVSSTLVSNESRNFNISSFLWWSLLFNYSKLMYLCENGLVLYLYVHFTPFRTICTIVP